MDDHFAAGSCSHTADGEHDGAPWWRVEIAALGDPVASVAAVRVLTRGDCCWERLNTWEVRIGYGIEPWQDPKCGFTQIVVPPGGRRTVRCLEPLHGRFVSIVMHNREPLTLCEVEVFDGNALPL
eukprot:TRINITY_DN9533_c0_g1_i3.p1 TRINITY_DN9533_c0_g1~~TRINITY_DN9533_c0_g1_i3.p1  ORF type:complete len:125 (-),score=9.10 TRINITY_DN9533_c0_g1_i3:328-702(-)